MAMTPDARTQAAYQAVLTQNPLCAKMTDAERAQMRAALASFLGADLAYIQASAQINPGTLHSQQGQPVATAGGPTSQTGSVTADTPIAGLGTIS